jgi:methyl-accepting chemotaxis protein
MISFCQIVQSSATTSSRVAKRVQHTSSSSHVVSAAVQSDLSELQSSISEMKNLSQSNFSARSAATLSATAGALNGVGDLLRSSIEQLDTDDNQDNEPIVTFPEPDTPSTPPPCK